TVLSASVTDWRRWGAASFLSLPRVRAEIACAVYCLSSISVLHSVPMWRLTEETVRSTLVTAWRLATSPVSTSPCLEKATTDGVVRAPSAFAITAGWPPSRAEPTALVVPRSIPTTRNIRCLPFCDGARRNGVRASPVGCGLLTEAVAAPGPTDSAGRRGRRQD